MTNDNEDIIISDPRLTKMLAWYESRNALIRALVLNVLLFGFLGAMAGFFVLMYRVGEWPLLAFTAAFFVGFVTFLKREL